MILSLSLLGSRDSQGHSVMRVAGQAESCLCILNMSYFTLHVRKLGSVCHSQVGHSLFWCAGTIELTIYPLSSWKGLLQNTQRELAEFLGNWAGCLLNSVSFLRSSFFTVSVWLVISWKTTGKNSLLSSYSGFNDVFLTYPVRNC